MHTRPARRTSGCEGMLCERIIQIPWYLQSIQGMIWACIRVCIGVEIIWNKIPWCRPRGTCPNSAPFAAGHQVTYFHLRLKRKTPELSCALSYRGDQGQPCKYRRSYPHRQRTLFHRDFSTGSCMDLRGNRKEQPLQNIR
jgi:hypothetical protein